MAAKHEHRRTVARDLSIGLAITVLVVAVFAGGTFHLVTRHNAEARLQADTARWTAQFAEVSAIHLWNVDQEGLENTCRAALQPPEVLGVRILDAEGRTLAEASRSEGPHFQSKSEDVFHESGGKRHRLGSVELYVGRSLLDERAAERLQATALLIMVVVAAVVLACQLLLRRYLSNPLDQLGAGIERIAAGDYSSKLAPAEPDDIDAIVQGINSMAAEIAAREEKLRHGEEQLRYALSAAQGGVWDWNVHEESVHFSPAWKAMLGYEDDEVENSFEAWERLLHPEDLPAARAAVQDHLEGNTDHYVLEHRLKCKDGTYLWIAARGKLISRSADGSPGRFVGTHTDISQQIQAAEALRSAKEAAEQATRAKDEFLANMSHEIRTPLNGILGMTSVLLTTELSGEQRDLAETVQGSGDALVTIVNDILDFSRIESGSLSIAALPLDPRASCREAEELLATQASERGLQLRVEVSPDVPAAVRGDAGRIRQVLLNLLGNAIKFSDEGEICLRLTSSNEGEGRVRLRYEVQDHGIGIPAGAIPHLFSRFSQVDSSSTRTRGGTGLGLAICGQLASLMDGQIGVESELGVGSTFWVEFVLTLCEPEAKSGPQSCECHEVQASSQRLRVLLAEDNRVNALVAQALLDRLNLEVDTVTDGKQALSAFEAETYDLVLLDVQMPELDGLQAATEIRRREEEEGRSERVPIVALTASALPSDRRSCLEAGMDDFLAKPLTLASLSKTLLPWLKRAEV